MFRNPGHAPPANEFDQSKMADPVITGDVRREKSYASLRELGFFYADVPPDNITVAVKNCKAALILSGMREFQVPKTVEMEITHPLGGCFYRI